MRMLARGDEGSLESRHGSRSKEIREAVGSYMASCPAVLATPSVRGPTASSAASEGVSFHSDGEWLWSSSGTEAFRSGRIDLEPEFVDHAYHAGSCPTSLAPEHYEQARQLLIDP